MMNVPDTFCHFLDLEAQVDNEEDNGGYGDELESGELTLVFSMRCPLKSLCILDDFIDNQDYG